MHNLYEGLFLDMFSSISTEHWQEFDEIFMQQKYPSFLHRQPRSVASNLGHLKAIEVYMIAHYYLPLFKFTKNFSKIKSIYNVIKRLTDIVDKLTDEFNTSDMKSLYHQLLDVMEEYQTMVGVEKTSMNFHIACDMTRSCLFFGPLAHNSAFIGENLNFTLSKAYVSHNSARYSIMFLDMSQLCDIYGLSSFETQNAFVEIMF